MKRSQRRRGGGWVDRSQTMNGNGEHSESWTAERLAFSIQETAAMLGICDKSVRRLILRDLLRPSRALRHLLIPRTEIERFLRETR